MEWMLDKKDREKVQLMKLLFDDVNQEVSVRHIMAELGWSRYLTLDVVKKLADVLGEVYDLRENDEPFLYLAEGDKMVVFGHSRHINVDAVVLYMLRQSLTWQFMKELFLETITSYEDFAERNLTTVGTVRNIKAKLAERLHEQDIEISDDYKLIGEETNIRVFNFRLAQRYFGDREFPWGADLLTRADDAIDRLVKYVLPEPYIRDTKRIAMRFHYAIAYIRISQGHVLANDFVDDVLKPTRQLDDLAKKVIAVTSQESMSVFGLTAEQAEVEARNTLFYMYGLEIVGEMDWYANSTTLVKNIIDKMSDVIEEYYQDYFGAALLVDKLDRLKWFMFAPLITYLVYPHDSGARRTFNMAESYRRYPLLAEMALNISYHLSELLHDDQKSVETFFFPYFFTSFVGVFDAREIFPAIVVDIDINYRPGLELMIQNIIQGMPEFNVVFKNRFEDDVDLIISDAMLTSIDSRNRFNWTDLPSPKQIEHLRQRLSDLKRQKFYHEIG
jgi:hypothetical protein